MEKLISHFFISNGFELKSYDEFWFDFTIPRFRSVGWMIVCPAGPPEKNYENCKELISMMKTFYPLFTFELQGAKGHILVKTSRSESLATELAFERTLQKLSDASTKKSFYSNNIEDHFIF